jgi:hypothetical protein
MENSNQSDSFFDDNPVEPAPQPPLPKVRRSPRKVLNQVLNCLSLLLLAGAVAVGVFYALIYTNPSSGFNPFPAPTQVATLFIPSITPLPTRTITPIPPTLTVTISATFTSTPRLPSPTAIKSNPIGTFTTVSGTPPTPGPKTPSAFAFAIQGDPKAIDATLLDSSHGCTWMGVGGRVYDLAGGPATKIEVQLFGILDSKLLNETSLTGTAIQYGPSGYEFTLGNKTIASKQRLSIQLLDQSGVPLSDKIFFDTFSECPKNLMIINFKQVR